MQSYIEKGGIEYISIWHLERESKISRQTIYNWIVKNNLKKTKNHGRVYIERGKTKILLQAKGLQSKLLGKWLFEWSEEDNNKKRIEDNTKTGTCKDGWQNLYSQETQIKQLRYEKENALVSVEEHRERYNIEYKEKLWWINKNEENTKRIIDLERKSTAYKFSTIFTIFLLVVTIILITVYLNIV